MYKACFYDKSTRICHVWDDKLGHREIEYEKYAYTYGNGPYLSMFGDSLAKITGDEIQHYHNSQLFEADVNPETRTIIDNYLDEDTVPEGFTIINFDIEVETESDYLDVWKANNEITSIALTDNISGDYVVLILDKDNRTEYRKKGNVEVIPFDNEKQMLQVFIDKWNEINPDAITGWNIQSFDVPYLLNRIKTLFHGTKRHELSKIDKIYYDKTYNEYRIPGVSTLDYMLLYKQYTFGEKSSYSLNNIANHEIGKTKIEYDGNLDDLFRTDIEKFIEYNLTDVKLVKELDDKLKFIDLAISIAHICHVPYEQIYMSSRVLDGAILTYLKRKNLVAPNKKPKIELKVLNTIERGDKIVTVDKVIPSHFPRKGVVRVSLEKQSPVEFTYDGYDGNTIYLTEPAKSMRRIGSFVSYKFEGAYVEDPNVGRYKWLYSIDLESLYPSIIRTLGISPETKQGRIIGWRDFYFMGDFDKYIEDLENGNLFSYLSSQKSIKIQTPEKVVEMETGEFINLVKTNKLKIAGNGAIYRTDIEGIIPSILTDWFNKRKVYKSSMKEAKENNNRDLAQFYDRYQQVQKVLLNSMYGVLGLPTFRFYDLDNAEAVTLTGQDIIKFSQRAINRKYKEQNFNDDTYVIYSDTDSVSGDSTVHSWDHGSIPISELWGILDSDEKHYYKKYNRDGRQFIHPKYIKLPYHDEKYRSVKYGRVEYIERHKVKKKMYRVMTNYGKWVDITEDHSIMVMNFDDPKKQMFEIRPEDIVPNYHQVYIANHYVLYDKVVSVEDLGEVDDWVYDVGMRESPNTFFANDILVHNSVYVRFPSNDWSMDEMIKFSGKIEIFINDKLKQFAKYHLNSDESYLNFKREKISESGFWLAKKRYAQRVKWDEGFEKNTVSVTGLDVVRSSFPKEFKEFMMDILHDILFFESEETIKQKIRDFVSTFPNVPYWDLARNSAVKKIDDYEIKYRQISQFKTGTPIAVKAALAYNRLLKYFKCDYKYTPIGYVDKIKYVILSKNPYNFETLAFKGDNDPPQIKQILEQYANKDAMFENELEGKLKQFYEALKWEYVSPYNAASDDFFNF